MINEHSVESWELQRARREGNGTLKNWIWEEVRQGQPLPGSISVDACRHVLRERGEDGMGYHNT